MISTRQSEPPWGAYRLKASQRLLLAAQRHSPVARRRLRAAVLTKLGADERQSYDIEVGGIRARCHPFDNASERKLLLEGARKDRAQLRQVVSHLSPGGTFVDIGANFGLYTLHAARTVGPGGRVVAIEPNAEMARRLRFNISANALDNVAIHEVAVGERPGTATLHVNRNKQGAGTLVDIPSDSDCIVPIVPLVELLQKSGLPKVDVLKIDVEGYEDRVLLPYLATAPRILWPRMILIEVSWSARWQVDCVAKLLQSGYHVTWKGRDDLALVLK